MKRVSKKTGLTKRVIDELKPPSKGVEHHYCDRTPGLAVVVSASGAKAFYWVGRAGGRACRMKLGNYPDMTLDQARRAASVAKGVAVSGRELVASKLGALSDHTVGELWAWYLEHHAKPFKRTWGRDVSTYEKDIARWSRWRITEIDQRLVRETANAIHGERGPGAANKFIELLRSMYGKAVDPLRWMALADIPTQGVSRYRIESRDRFIEADELPRFFTALATLRQPARDLLLVSLLTGARRSNVQSMRRDELNLDAGRWAIPAEKSKNKRPMTVVLSLVAVTVLRERLASHDSEWVFPSWSRTGHYVELKGAWKTLLKRSGLTNLRPHDLRRTLASWQAAMGSSLQIIGKSLGHASLKSTAIYARLQMDPIRDSVELATGEIIRLKDVK